MRNFVCLGLVVSLGCSGNSPSTRDDAEVVRGEVEVADGRYFSEHGHCDVASGAATCTVAESGEIFTWGGLPADGAMTRSLKAEKIPVRDDGRAIYETVLVVEDDEFRLNGVVIATRDDVPADGNAIPALIEALRNAKRPAIIVPQIGASRRSVHAAVASILAAGDDRKAWISVVRRKSKVALPSGGFVSLLELGVFPMADPVTLKRLKARMSEAHQAMQPCYDTAVAESPGLEGTIKLKFFVTLQGEIVEPSIVTSDFTDDSFHACVLGVLTEVRFNEPLHESRDRVPVTFPFMFSP